jgi:nicotinamidase-related amidase
VICDMWDQHWSTGATRRVEALAPKVDAFCARLRDAGCLVVHAPSGTMDAYANHPARLRALQRAQQTCPLPAPGRQRPPLPPLPVDDAAGGSDTEDAFPAGYKAWTRQHRAIAVHEDLDIVTDEGAVIGAFLASENRKYVLMTGVHTNMCVLHRSFGLLALGSMGFCPVLVADLTDAMYDPATSPYVNHDEGTNLVINYIKSFVAPTTLSTEIAALPK